MDIDAQLSKNMSVLSQTIKTILIDNFKKYEINGAVVEIDIDFDLERMSTKQKKSIDLIDVYGTKLAVKKALEKKDMHVGEGLVSFYFELKIAFFILY